MDGFTIGAVERDTGLSREVLRVWERRYGFPSPARDANGERVYPVEQVDRLRLIKRLMDQGHRPGRLIASPPDALADLSPKRATPAPVGAAAEGDLDRLLESLHEHDGPGLLASLQSRLAREGLRRFVIETVAPLTRRVGEAWQAGRLETFEEHLFTELTQRVLRQAIAALPEGRQGPRVILTTPPDELHGLGLLMAEALFALEGARCIALGTQMPALDVQRAARAHAADVVALSLSSAFPTRQVGPLVAQLRGLLPAAVEIWIGGAGAARARLPEGALRIETLPALLGAVAEWRAARADR